MKRTLSIPGLMAVLIFAACTEGKVRDNKKADIAMDTTASKKEIAAMLDSFNIAAANADYEGYFNFFAPHGVFMGTDATEHWNKEQFKVWAKPYFDKKKTWNFSSIQRHIYFSMDRQLAWFDELLQTQMKICRGSGVVIRSDTGWKIEQYVLSMTIPNSKTDMVVPLKAPEEDSLMAEIKK